MKTKQQLAEDYANNTRPIEGLDKHDAPFLTAFEHHEDVSDAFIAGYEAAQQWISVDDELPQNITTVLVCGNSMRTTALFEDGFFYPDFGVVGSIITHWLPIPKLPTE